MTITVDGRPLEEPIAMMVSREEREHIDRLRQASAELAVERMHMRR